MKDEGGARPAGVPQAHFCLLPSAFCLRYHVSQAHFWFLISGFWFWQNAERKPSADCATAQPHFCLLPSAFCLPYHGTSTTSRGWSASRNFQTPSKSNFGSRA
jgi:hypothetical protein